MQEPDDSNRGPVSEETAGRSPEPQSRVPRRCGEDRAASGDSAPQSACRRGGSAAAAECGRFSSKGKNGILPVSLKRVPVAPLGRLDESSGRLEKGSGCSDGVSAASVESRPLRPSAVSGDGPAAAANLPPRPSRRPAIANNNQKHFLFLTKFISLPCKGSERGAPPPTD